MLILISANTISLLIPNFLSSINAPSSHSCWLRGQEHQMAKLNLYLSAWDHHKSVNEYLGKRYVYKTWTASYFACLNDLLWWYLKRAPIIGVIEDKSAPGTVILSIQTVSYMSSIPKPHKMAFSFPSPPVPPPQFSTLQLLFARDLPPPDDLKDPLTGHASEISSKHHA
jgi:hypothetical protein